MAFLLLAFTLLDVKTAECKTACQWAGYDGGDYVELYDACRCWDLKSYKRMTGEKKILLQKKVDS